MLDQKSQVLEVQIQTHPEVEVTYFAPDEKKGGRNVQDAQRFA